MRSDENWGRKKGESKMKTLLRQNSTDRITMHIEMHLLSLRAIALCRLQNGITTGLIDLAVLI